MIEESANNARATVKAGSRRMPAKIAHPQQGVNSRKRIQPHGTLEAVGANAIQAGNTMRDCKPPEHTETFDPEGLNDF